MQTRKKKLEPLPADAPVNHQTAGDVADVRRISLGSLGAATRKTGSKYPVLPDPTGVIATAVDAYLKEIQELEALEASVKSQKAEFRDWAFPFYLKTCAGRVEIPSSIMALSDDNALLCTFQDRYPAFDPDWQGLQALLGDSLADCVHETFDVKIDGAKLPANTAQAFVTELAALAEKHGAAAAITAKAKVKPVPGFHTRRHTILTPEQNRDFDFVCPGVMSIKTKGVKR